MILIGWEQFQEDCETLAKRIAAAGNAYDKMLCVTRGGVFVGGLLAHFLDIRNITTMALRLYEGTEPGASVTEISSPDMPPPGSRVLVVDDLLDSGRTLAHIKRKWGHSHRIEIAVLYDKGGGNERPDFFARNYPNEWVWFPWYWHCDSEVQPADHFWHPGQKKVERPP